MESVIPSIDAIKLQLKIKLNPPKTIYNLHYDDLHFFFALHLSLGGKLEVCGRDDLFLLFTIFGPAGLAFNYPPPLFKFLGTLLNQHLPDLHYIYRCTTVIQFKLVKSTGYQKISFRAFSLAKFLPNPPCQVWKRSHAQSMWLLSCQVFLETL